MVAVEEVFEDEASVHIVMELCSGGDLSEFMRSQSNLDRDGIGVGACSERDAACIIRTVLQVSGAAEVVLVHAMADCVALPHHMHPSV